MAKERESIFTDNIVPWKGWPALTEQIDSLPKPVQRRDEGDLYEQEWVFRGHKKDDYPLEPSIERIHTEWAEAEHRMVQEFQSKAPLHMDSSLAGSRPCSIMVRQRDSSISRIRHMWHCISPCAIGTTTRQRVMLKCGP